MTLEEQIKALLEAKEKDNEKDQDQADRVDDEPAVKIENPMTPGMQSSEISPEGEIAAADQQGGDVKKNISESTRNVCLTEEARAAVNTDWNTTGHKIATNDHFSVIDPHLGDSVETPDTANSVSVKLNRPITLSNAKIHNSYFKDGVPEYKNWDRHEDLLDSEQQGISYENNITVPAGQHVSVVTRDDPERDQSDGFIIGHHPAHGFFKVDVDKDQIKDLRQQHTVTYDPNRAVNESISDLLGDEFSKEFKLKAQTIFEATVKDQVVKIEAKLQEEKNAAVAKLEQEFEEKFVQRSKQLEEETGDKIDGYLNFLAEEWKKDNEVALEAAIKSELTESFIDNLKSLFEQHYVDLPEQKVDLYAKVVEEKTEVESALATTVGSLKKLTEELNQIKRDQIIEEASKEFSSLDQARFKTLTEDFAFEDADTFKTKVGIVKKSFFSQKSNAKEQLAEELVKTEQIVESGQPVQIVENTVMSAYLSVLSKKK